MGKFIKIIANPVHAKLVNPDTEARQISADAISYLPVTHPDYVADRETFYVFKTDSFPAGFVRLVAKKLTLAGYKVTVVRQEAPAPLGPENPKVDEFPEDPRYDYQPETVARLIQMRGMIARVATGGGKSRIFKLAAKRIARPTLFITTRKILMYQMKEACENLGMPLGIMGDGVWTPTKTGINFAIVDTLSSRLTPFDAGLEIEKLIQAHKDKVEEGVLKVLKKNKLPTKTTAIKNLPKEIKDKIEQVRRAVEKKWPMDEQSIIDTVEAKQKTWKEKYQETVEILRHVEFVTIEEAHEVSSDSFFRAMSACRNAHYRLALTATPFMRDDEEANMRLMAVAGPIGIVVSEEMLIERGILAKPYFRYIDVSAPAGFSRSAGYQRAYKEGIVEHAGRNNAITLEALRGKKYGLTMMVLVQRKDHGTRLVEVMEKHGLRVKFIYGDSNQAARKAALKQLESGDLDVVIGTNILDVGVDVPAVGMVALGGGGKAEVAIRQRIGRGLRAKKHGPNVCFIIDFSDRHSRHLSKHSIERRKIVEKTPGFAEGVIKGDFNFEELGFSPITKTA